MATTLSELVALLECHRTGDSVRFWTITKQILAKAKSNGHEKNAIAIERVLQKASTRQMTTLQFKHEVRDLLIQKVSTASLEELVVEPAVKDTIRAFIREYRSEATLARYHLSPRRKLLLHGNPGTGKTMTANIIATELELPLVVINTAGVIGSHLGDTGRNLFHVFDSMKSIEAVYLFDEADSLFAARDHTSGADREMSRAASSLLQFMEEWENGVMICATNLNATLDTAFFRRFDIKLEYKLPTHEEAAFVFKNALHYFGLLGSLGGPLTEIVSDMGHAEIYSLAKDAARDLVLYQRPLLSTLEKRGIEWR